MSVQRQVALESFEDTQKGRYLTFVIEDEGYGLEIQYVTEIIGIQKITEVPDLPVFLKGIINLRGKIIPVMDVRLRFSKPPMAYHDRTCIIVVDVGGISLGLIVDTVSEVLDIEEKYIVPPPVTLMGSSNQYLKNIGIIGNEVKLLLDCNKLLQEDELNQLTQLR